MNPFATNDPTANKGDFLGRDYEFDYELTDDSIRDRNKLSTHEFLDKHGLGQIAQQLSQFISIFDSSAHFFDKINDHTEFEVLNRVISLFRDSYVATVEESKRVPDTSSGPVSLTSMRDFLSRQEMLFNARLQHEPSFKKWAKVLSQTHLLFDSMKQLYQLCIESGVPMQWWMVHMTGPLVSNLPDRMFDHGSFQEILSVPSALQQKLHEILEDVFTSGYGPMLKLAMQTVSTFVANQHPDL